MATTNASPASCPSSPVNPLAASGVYDHCVVCGADTTDTPAPWADAVCVKESCWLEYSGSEDDSPLTREDLADYRADCEYDQRRDDRLTGDDS